MCGTYIEICNHAENSCSNDESDHSQCEQVSCSLLLVTDPVIVRNRRVLHLRGVVVPPVDLSAVPAIRAGRRGHHGIGRVRRRGRRGQRAGEVERELLLRDGVHPALARARPEVGAQLDGEELHLPHVQGHVEGLGGHVVGGGAPVILKNASIAYKNFVCTDATTVDRGIN